MHGSSLCGRRYRRLQVSVGTLGAHLWLEVGVAVEQWWDGEQEWLPEKVVSASLRMTWSVAGTFLEIYWNRELGRNW